jgi:hypothetical protein
MTDDSTAPGGRNPKVTFRFDGVPDMGREWSMAPNGLWSAHWLSPYARLILGWLHSHDPEYLAAHVSFRGIMRSFRCGQRTVRSALDELVDAGFVTEESSPGRPTSFTVLRGAYSSLRRPPTVRDSDTPDDDPTVRETDTPDEWGVRATDTPPVRETDTDAYAPRVHREDQEKTKGEDHLFSAADAADEEPAVPVGEPSDLDFQRWWGSYPRKLDKADAEKAWRSLRSKRKLPPVEALIEATVAYVAWAAANDTPIKYPATWLRKRSWENDLEGGGTIDPRAVSLAVRYRDWYRGHHDRECPATEAEVARVVSRFLDVPEADLRAAMKDAAVITVAALEVSLRRGGGDGQVVYK